MTTQLDNATFSVSFNGLEYPMLINADRQIEIVENVKQFVPVVRISLDDTMRSFASGSPLNDGTPISIALSDNLGSGSPTNYSFRAFGTPQRTRGPNNTGMPHYSVIGILDVHPYLRSSPMQAFQGTSLQVMQAAATNLGLNLVTNIENTVDNMIWRPAKDAWAQFLTRVSVHAHVDDTSLVTHNVDIDKNLRFHNITDLYQNAKPKAYLFRGVKQSGYNNLPTFNCINDKGTNRSGAMNMFNAYGQRTTQLNQAGVNTTLNQVKASVFGNSLDISGAVVSAVNQVKNTLLAPVANVINTVKNAENQIVGTIAGVESAVSSTVNQITGTLLAPLTNPLGPLLTNPANQALFGPLNSQINSLVAQTNMLIAKNTNIVSTSINSSILSLSNYTNGLIGQATALLNTANAGINDVNALLNTANSLANTAANVVQAAANLVNTASRLMMAPVDVGNTHSNYMPARHRNLRLLSTYTQNIYVFLINSTGLKVYDKVQYTKTDGAGNLDTIDSGEYLITAKTRILHGGRYFEKLELTNSGPSNNSQQLAGSADNSDFNVISFGIGNGG